MQGKESLLYLRFFQVCSNYAPGTENGPAAGVILAYLNQLFQTMVLLHMVLLRIKLKGIKIRQWNCADKYIFIELSELIGFGYDLNDT